MCPHSHSSAVSGPLDRADQTPPSGGAGRRWFRVPAFRFPALGATALKPLTYSMMHLMVAVSVAFVLTRDWRVALGVGIIEPMVQTVAYVLHEKAWAAGVRKQG